MPIAALLTLLCVGVPILAIFTIPFYLIWTSHRRKMVELNLQRQRLIADDIRAEFAAIREEIRELRDTTMQYDLSFDTAMHQMERRLSHVERQTRTLTETPAQQNITLGGC
jgi:hypothetical protein